MLHGGANMNEHQQKSVAAQFQVCWKELESKAKELVSRDITNDNAHGLYYINKKKLRLE